jgi:SMC interacting uncharacterized protein involved in chromosome segregation
MCAGEFQARMNGFTHEIEEKDAVILALKSKNKKLHAEVCKLDAKLEEVEERVGREYDVIVADLHLKVAKLQQVAADSQDAADSQTEGAGPMDVDVGDKRKWSRGPFGGA